MNEPNNKNIIEHKLQIYSRHLPHWRLTGKLYFITFRIVHGELSCEEQKLVLEHIKQGNNNFYTLYVVMVMPDHVHLMIMPKENYSISRIMKGIKGVSARKINMNRKSSGSIWQNEFYDRIIRNYDELYEKLNYILLNPVKCKLTENPLNYHGWYFNDSVEIL